MSRRDEIAVFDHEVMDGHGRQLQLQGMPVLAIVEGDVYPGLCTRVEQPAPDRIFADHPCKVIFSESPCDLRPGLAIVLRFGEIRLEIVLFVAIGGYIGRGGIVWRRLYDADERPLGQIWRRHVLPALAAIARDMHETIIRACPEKSTLQG